MRRESATGLIVGAIFGLVVSALVMLGNRNVVLRILVLPAVTPTAFLFVGHRVGIVIGLCFTPLFYALAGGLVGAWISDLKDKRGRQGNRI